MANTEDVRTNAMRDQAWASLRESEGDIRRIALNGMDGSERDHSLCRQVFYVVAGELLVLAREVDEGGGR